MKYWGMRDPALGLPFNSSLSMTLDRLRTRTRVRFDPALAEDRLTLNGRPAAAKPREAVRRFLDLVREAAGIDRFADVVSDNNFPTASGLASSASGFAALAGAGAMAAGLRLSPRALSRLARRGSGSASRSVFGGFVVWRAGRRADGRDSYAAPVLPPGHWPDLRDLVVIIADAPEKPVRSAEAMQSTVATSPDYRARLAAVPLRLRRIEAALRARDRRRFLPLLVEECDEFRRVCETTVPSLDYLTRASREVLAAVRELNDDRRDWVAGYTHDAGAHLHLFTTRPFLRDLARRVRAVRGVAALRVVRPGPGARPVGGTRPA